MSDDVRGKTQDLGMLDEEQKPQKVSKLHEKKARIHQERRQRLLNDGCPPELVDAKIAEEDWRVMPVDKRIEIIRGDLINLRSQVAGAIQGMSNDISALHGNQQHLADSMDVNFEAFAQMLVRLGISQDDQKAVVELATNAIQRARHEAAAKEEAKTVEDAVDKPAPTEAPSVVPEGATEFGENG